MTQNEISDTTVIDLARIITDLDRDVVTLRAELNRIRATHYDCDDTPGPGSTRPERVGPIEEEPTDLGAVIVAASRDPMSDGMCIWVNAATDTYPWLCVEHEAWCMWSDLTAPRWATARERATGKVDAEQDEAEPEASGYPEWLESEAEYDAAPLGTQAAGDVWGPLTRKYDGWHMDCDDYRVQPVGGRRVTRWGFGPGWEPGTDVTDRTDQAPEGVIVQDRDGDYWHSNADGWFFWLGADTGWGTAPASLTTFVDLAPITVATTEQLRATGILTGSEQPQDEEEN